MVNKSLEDKEPITWGLSSKAVSGNRYGGRKVSPMWWAFCLLSNNMKYKIFQFLRISINFLLLISIILAIIYSWYFLLATVVLYIIHFFIYASRKARIRYWFQGYKTALLKNNNDEHLALLSVYDEFRSSKYGDDLDLTRINNINSLIHSIIIREFHILESIPKLGVEFYIKSLSEIIKEIDLIKNEILPNKINEKH